MNSNVLPLRGARPAHGTSTEDGAIATHTPTAGAQAVYSVREVASLLNLSLGSTYQLVREGEIPALKLGSRWVIPKRRFHSWLDNLSEA